MVRRENRTRFVPSYIGTANPTNTNKDTSTGLHQLAPKPVAVPTSTDTAHVSQQMAACDLDSKIRADTYKRVVAYLEPLIQEVHLFLPRQKIKSIPLFVMATGGMRRLEEQQHDEYLILRDAVVEYIKTCGFGDSQYKTISGEDEGLYGWVAANYIDQKFRPSADTHGFMEMGGESAQFAVALQGPDYGGYTGMLREVQIGGEKYQVFVKTWLGIGADSSWKRHEERLRASESAIPHDPCLPREFGYRLSGSDKIVVGTADFVQCLKEAFSLLSCPKQNCIDGNLCIFQAAPSEGPKLASGCLLNDPDSGKPFMTFDTKKFDGSSVYWHAMHGIFGRSNGPDDFQEFWTQVEDLSAMTWEQIIADKVDTPSRFVMKAFFTAAMVMSTLFYGFGIPMPAKAIETTRKIAMERTVRALARAEVEEVSTKKKFKAAELKMHKLTERAEKADQAEIDAVDNNGLWPTKQDAEACKALYDARPNEANRQDMIATVLWRNGAADAKAKTAQAAKTARAERANASAMTTETYSNWVMAKTRVRQAQLLKKKLPSVHMSEAQVGGAGGGSFGYTSIQNADWPLGRIVLHANSSGIDVRSRQGWEPVAA